MTRKNGLLAALDVRTSAIHGRGVFATRDIPAHTRIGRYGGQRFSHGEAHPGAEPPGLTYLFGLSDGSYIDGSRGGNVTRFINHSCAPNCVAIEVATGGRLSIVIESLHPICQGQELFLDYALEVGESDVDRHECRCGAPACRGTMAGPRQCSPDDGPSRV